MPGVLSLADPVADGHDSRVGVDTSPTGGDCQPGHYRSLHAVNPMPESSRSVLSSRCSNSFSIFKLQNIYIFTIVEDMRKREYRQMELMVFLAAIRPADDAYGVQICREIFEKSGREVALASVYAALERLETKGLLIPPSATLLASGAAKRAHTLRLLRRASGKPPMHAPRC